MLLEKFNQTIAIWIRELEKYNLNQLQAKPGNQSWSLGQLYIHLIEDTHWYIQQIELSLQETVHRHQSFSENGKILFARGSFHDAHLKGNPENEHIPQPNSKEELDRGLKQIRKKINDLWEVLKGRTVYGKSEHPAFGFLNGFEWIAYAEMHMRHHFRQKSRIDKFLEENNLMQK